MSTKSTKRSHGGASKAIRKNLTGRKQNARPVIDLGDGKTRHTRKGVANGESKGYFEPSSGKYVYKIYLPRDENGHKLAPIVRRRDSKDAARDAAIAELTRRNQYGSLRPVPRASVVRPERMVTPNITVGKYADIWLDWKRDQSGCSEVTAKNNEAYVRLHIKPYIGHLKVSAVTKGHIDELMNHTLKAKKGSNGKPLGYATRQHVYQTLRAMFKRAVEVDDLLSKNPVIDDFKPKKVKTEELIRKEKVWARTELVYKVLAEAYERWFEDPLEYVWLRLMFLGLRQGERGGVSFADIENLYAEGQASLNINKQLVGEGKANSGEQRGIYLKSTLKTNASYRTVPIDDRLRLALVVLYEERQELLASGDLVTWAERKNDPRFNDLVLLTPSGHPFYQQYDRKLWRAYLDRLAERGDLTRAEQELVTSPWRGHINRKIAATMLYRLGMKASDARLILGHDTEAMTEYYTAFRAESLRGEINKLSSLQDKNNLAEFKNEYYSNANVFTNRFELLESGELVDNATLEPAPEYFQKMVDKGFAEGWILPGIVRVPDMVRMPSGDEIKEQSLDL